MVANGLTRRASLALALGAASAAAPARAAGAGPWARVDAAATKLIAEQATPGVSISVMRKGRLVYSKGFGHANLETRTIASPGSVYLIGSITKQFTAASLLLLAERRKLSLDDKLSVWFPDFPRGGEITLRQMLSHTAGLADYIGKDFIQKARQDYDAAALYKLMRDTDPLFAYAPGTVWLYSNTAYVLLGLIVEKASGMPYERFVRDELVARAGLTHTAVDDAAEVVPGRASGYAWGQTGPGGWRNSTFVSRTIASGAGAMRSTSEDLCRWHDALLKGRVVSDASLREMITPARLADGAFPKKALKPADQGPALPVQYGLGLEIDTIDGRQTIGHHGSIQGFTANFLTFPQDEVSIAILANCRNEARFHPAERAILTAVVAAAVKADFSRKSSVFF